MVDSENHVFVTGNLVREPELRETPKGKPVCTFSLASNRNYKLDGEPQDEVSFFVVETWAALAENCAKHLVKGQEVRVTGRLRQDRWQSSEGEKRERVKIVANQVKFGRKPRNKEVEPEIMQVEQEDLLKAV